MSKLPPILVAFIALGSSATNAAPPAKALEEQVQKVIDDSSAAVVAVVASHRAYPAEKAAAPKPPGRLGEYTPAPPKDADNDPPGKLRPFDRLDLRLAENVTDNQFGSGLVLDAEAGLILTPFHLIDGATKIFVRTSNGQGSYADIHAADAKADLAVLKLIRNVKGLSAAKLGTARFVTTPDGTAANLKRGSMLVALGHPLAAGFADGKPSGSWGILSNLRRRPAPASTTDDLRSKLPLYHYGSLIQTDARIALGSSGAALLNLDGEVIGMSSAIAAVTGSEASGGYAIPFDANYRRIIGVLQAGREVEYGFLGIRFSREDSILRRITDLTSGCPAALAGLKTGDTILEADGHPLNDHDDLLLYVGGALAGTEVTLTVGRGTLKLRKTLTLAKMDNALPSISSTPGPGFAGLRIDYSSMMLFKNGIQTGADDVPTGVIVRELEPGSPAEKKLKDVSTWMVTRVGDTPITNPAEFAKAVAGQKSIALKLVDPSVPSKSVVLTLP